MVLPAPVAPATSKWGICVRSAMHTSPAISLPKAKFKPVLRLLKALCSKSSRMTTGSRSSLEISIPTRPFPGMGASTRTPLAFKARAILSMSFVKRFTKVPGAGSSSKRVTVGPRLTWVTLASVLKVARQASSFVAKLPNFSWRFGIIFRVPCLNRSSAGGV